jgi:hypothetical protein
MRNSYTLLARKPEGKRPFEKSRHRWGCIKMDLKETGCEIVEWIHLSQYRDEWQAFLRMVYLGLYIIRVFKLIKLM